MGFADTLKMDDMTPDLAAGFSCSAAGRAAEQNNGLPANLLQSIGIVESGRVDSVTGVLMPWPWTVNVDGEGHYFASEPEAASFARLAESSGATDVDVGCFQISLKHHQDAFVSIDAAFDPRENADFAARFLYTLKTQSGSWDAAIADYHSASPELGLPYQRRVLAAWRGFGTAPMADEADSFQADPSVILLAPAARSVRVITMDGETGPPVAAWLPRVITP